MTISAAHFEEAPYPIYRKEAPPDRALVLVLGVTPHVLHYVGPGLDWIYDHTSFMQDCGFSEFNDLPPGLWIWEGRLKSEQTLEGDYDAYLVGDYRELTPEELERFLDNISGEAPWDDRLWVENYDDLVSQG